MPHAHIRYFFDGAGDPVLEVVAKPTYHTQPCNAIAWSASEEQLAISGDDRMMARSHDERGARTSSTMRATLRRGNQCEDEDWPPVQPERGTTRTTTARSATTSSRSNNRNRNRTNSNQEDVAPDSFDEDNDGKQIAREFAKACGITEDEAAGMVP